MDDRCAACGQPFTEGKQTEQERRDEFAGNFPDHDIDEVRAKGELTSICDRCYPGFKAWLDSLTPEQRADIEAGREPRP